MLNGLRIELGCTYEQLYRECVEDCAYLYIRVEQKRVDAIDMARMNEIMMADSVLKARYSEFGRRR